MFTLLDGAGFIPATLAASLKKMVGFRNIAVHKYQTLQLPITIAVIEQHLPDFLEFTRILLQREA